MLSKLNDRSRHMQLNRTVENEENRSQWRFFFEVEHNLAIQSQVLTMRKLTLLYISISEKHLFKSCPAAKHQKHRSGGLQTKMTFLWLQASK